MTNAQRQHLIVIFDKSGSMNEAFAAEGMPGVADVVAGGANKIEEAKKALIERLQRASFNFVTIIPFNHEVDDPISGSLPEDRLLLQARISGIQASGRTYLSNALVKASEIGMLEAPESSIRYLVLTDGLSDTLDRDVSIVSSIPSAQGVDGILIDPTPRGEAHMKRICVNGGSWVSVWGGRDLQPAVDRHLGEWEDRIELSHSWEFINRSAATLSSQVPNESVSDILRGVGKLAETAQAATYDRAVPIAKLQALRSASELVTKSAESLIAATFEYDSTVVAVQNVEQSLQRIQMETSQGGVGELRLSLANLFAKLPVQAARIEQLTSRMLRAYMSITTSAEDSTWVRIFFATDRKRRRRNSANDIGVFGNERAPNGKLSLGTCQVSIPKDHKRGRLESPSIIHFEVRQNPNKHIVLRGITVHHAKGFFSSLSRSVAKSEQKEVFVFIHGYNVTFEDAARRTAQLAHDLGFQGAPILYSWPSKGKRRGYTSDETTVTWFTPHLRAFLSDLTVKSGASKIHLIAHSMGNRALADALCSLTAETAADKPSFRQVVLTAPDIDADTFKALAVAIRPTAERLTMYSNPFDKALVLSRAFHGGYTRAGAEILLVPGMDTIDASGIDTSFMGHSFGNNRTIISDVFNLLRGEPPERRFGLTVRTVERSRYYAFVLSMLGLGADDRRPHSPRAKGEHGAPGPPEVQLLGAM